MTSSARPTRSTAAIGAYQDAEFGIIRRDDGLYAISLKTADQYIGISVSVSDLGAICSAIIAVVPDDVSLKVSDPTEDST